MNLRGFFPKICNMIILHCKLKSNSGFSFIKTVDGWLLDFYGWFQVLDTICLHTFFAFLDYIPNFRRQGRNSLSWTIFPILEYKEEILPFPAPPGFVCLFVCLFVLIHSSARVKHFLQYFWLKHRLTIAVLCPLKLSWFAWLI